MGHEVLKCKICGALVMEGHNDWECDSCEAVCNESTKWAWKPKTKIKYNPPVIKK